MSDRHEPRHEILGDPPRAVHPTDRLEPAAVKAMLTAPSAPELLEMLGITGTDHGELLPLLSPVTEDPELLEAVTDTANALRDGAGLDVPTAELAAHAEQLTALQQRLAPGEGLLAIMALAVSTSTVRQWHRRRGLGVRESWQVLADLGQQMRVHRRSSGRLGLHQLAWTALNWRGRLVHLGRLQFDLHRVDRGGDRERWVIGTHIPATGPLLPSAVDDALDRATEYFGTNYPDLAADRPAGAPAFGREFHCRSWLVNPLLTRALGEDSNLGDFAQRWEVLSTTHGDDDAAFFVFGSRPPYDVADLPRTTRLERLVAARLADGGGWDTGLGRLVR